jgi:NADPH-dependent 2,4-dienoyl-CoA reductase/sulfur reductase-like enzyme
MVAPVIIVGASAAGVSTAEALRQLDPAREIVIVGDEHEIAHDRPPLSKQLLEGSWTPDRAELLPAARKDRLDATLMLGHRASGLDLARRRLQIDGREHLEYSELVIATGVRPRRLATELPLGVFVLRTLADCTALRTEMLMPGAHLVVVGGGLIGLEVAATARKLGIEVTVIEPAPQALGRRFGERAAARLLELHRQRGVRFRFGVGVSELIVDGTERVSALRLTDGSIIDASVVLVSIGCVPNVEWLQRSGLDLADGVSCDEYCQAAPHIWAAGDVCRWYHSGYRRHVRFEQRLNASQQAAAVAANIVGPPRPYVPTPFYWSDQYEVRIQFAGLCAEGATESFELLRDDSYVFKFNIGEQLVGALGWNAATALVPLRRELASVLTKACA